MTSQQKGFVNELWFETLRIMMEQYTQATEKDAEQTFSTAEIINSIEQHHGIPQGLVGKKIFQLMAPDDFVKAMHRLGFNETSAGGLELHWLVKKKAAPQEG
jgi:hypothetical protein